MCKKYDWKGDPNKAFQEKSEDVWGKGVFSYNRVNFTNPGCNVKLKCIKHGEWFVQNSLSHFKK